MCTRKLSTDEEIADDGERGIMTEKTVMQIQKKIKNRFIINKQSNKYEYY